MLGLYTPISYELMILNIVKNAYIIHAFQLYNIFTLINKANNSIRGYYYCLSHYIMISKPNDNCIQSYTNYSNFWGWSVQGSKLLLGIDYAMNGCAWVGFGLGFADSTQSSPDPNAESSRAPPFAFLEPQLKAYTSTTLPSSQVPYSASCFTKTTTTRVPGEQKRR